MNGSLLRNKAPIPLPQALPGWGCRRVVISGRWDGRYTPSVRSKTYPQCEPAFGTAPFIFSASNRPPCPRTGRGKTGSQDRGSRLGQIRSTFLTRGAAHHHAESVRVPWAEGCGHVGGPVGVLPGGSLREGPRRHQILGSETEKCPVVGHVARRRG
jgi:hypothetical protein